MTYNIDTIQIVC